MKITESWLGLEGLQNGNPYLIRVREHMQPFIQSKAYPFRLDIIWKYPEGQNGLMPTDEQMEQMEVAENALVQELQADLQAVLSMVYLGNNQKVLYWYSKQVEESAKRINAVLQELPGFAVEINGADDPGWKQYVSVLKTVQG